MMGSPIWYNMPVWQTDTWTCHNSMYTHTRLTALFPGLPGWASTTKVKPIWILPKQETVSGSGISRAICKSAPCSRQITTPTPHHSVFYRPDTLPAAQPTASKHWRKSQQHVQCYINLSSGRTTQNWSNISLSILPSVTNQLKLHCSWMICIYN